MNHKGEGRVLVAMSGGVDSSVACALLAQAGYEVIGVTMQIWPPELPQNSHERGCCSLGAVEDARRVANRLGIPYYVLNLREEFEREVIDYFCAEYARGRTPNPCIMCNIRVKFKALLERALKLGATHVATGHYARVFYSREHRRFLLAKGRDRHKDQTYVLYGLNQDQLSHVLFPLGDFTKSQVRDIASRLGLPVAGKPESQEICFIPGGDYRGFLRTRVGRGFTPGPILDLDGRVVGSHQGIANYTIGQRKGLGTPASRPLYVVDLDPQRNAVVVGGKEDVFSRGLVAGSLNWITFDDPATKFGREGFQVEAQLRYKADPAPARVYPSGESDWHRVNVTFEEPQRAISPGQACVFYHGELVVGGGTIEERL